MQRVARFLLWFGLALLIVSTVSCGVGCLTAVGDAFEGTDGAGADITGVSIILLVVSITMIVGGALLKAFAPKSREEK